MCGMRTLNTAALHQPQTEKRKNSPFGSERKPNIKSIQNRTGGAISDISAKCAACLLRIGQKDSKINLKNSADAIRHEPNKKNGGII